MSHDKVEKEVSITKMKRIDTEFFVGDDKFPFRILTQHTRKSHEDWALHCHKPLELNYCESGYGTYYIGEETYPITPGSIFVISNEEYHMSVSDTHVDLKVVYFQPEMIWQGENVFDYKYLQIFFQRKQDFSHCISPQNPKSMELSRLFYELETEWEEQVIGYQLLIKALLLKILALIYRSYYFAEETSQKILKFHRDFEKISPALAFIDLHYSDQKLDLKALAEMSNFAPTYFSKIFNEMMSVSLNQYINQKRIDQACHLLKHTNHNICDIAFQSGFRDLSHFNRQFKSAKKITPKAYRQEQEEV